MIFSDSGTAMKVRKEAEKQLDDFLLEMCKTLRDHSVNHNPTDEALEYFVKNKRAGTLPPLVATLLFKSGIIHRSNDDGETYPVNLFYDDDSGYAITEAIGNSGNTLVGGLHKGRIHT